MVPWDTSGSGDTSAVPLFAPLQLKFGLLRSFGAEADAVLRAHYATRFCFSVQPQRGLSLCANMDADRSSTVTVKNRVEPLDLALTLKSGGSKADRIALSARCRPGWAQGASVFVAADATGGSKATIRMGACWQAGSTDVCAYTCHSHALAAPYAYGMHVQTRQGSQEQFGISFGLVAPAAAGLEAGNGASTTINTSQTIKQSGNMGKIGLNNGPTSTTSMGNAASADKLRTTLGTVHLCGTYNGMGAGQIRFQHAVLLQIERQELNYTYLRQGTDLSSPFWRATAACLGAVVSFANTNHSGFPTWKVEGAAMWTPNDSFLFKAKADSEGTLGFCVGLRGQDLLAVLPDVSVGVCGTLSLVTMSPTVGLIVNLSTQSPEPTSEVPNRVNHHHSHSFFHGNDNQQRGFAGTYPPQSDHHDSNARPSQRRHFYA